MLPKLKLTDRAAIPNQIAEFLRDEISSGRLKAGMRLPSRRELSAYWSVNPMSVHRSTEQLMFEGLLQKIHGKGIYVCEPKRFDRIGIYLSADPNATREFVFYDLLIRILVEKFQQRDVSCNIWIDNRPASEHGVVFPPIEQAIAGNRIQGLIVPRLDLPMHSWISRLPIPKVTFSSAVQYSYNLPPEQNRHLKECLKLLIGKNRTKISAIIPLKYAENFRESFAEFNLRQDFLRIFSSENGDLCNEFAYRTVLELFSSAEKPDALIVRPDVASQCAIPALAGMRIRIPEELSVCFDRNKGLEYFCPFPVDYTFETDTEEIAEKLIEKLYKEPAS